MAGPPFAQNRQKVDWEDGTTSYESGSNIGKLKKTPRPTAGEGPAYPGSSAGNPRKTVKGVTDTRSVKRKLDDAQARSVSRFDKKYKKIPKNSSVAGTKVDG